MRLLRGSFLAALVTSLVAITGCSASSSGDAATPGAEEDVTADAATLKLGANFTTSLTGEAVAGKGLRVEYALERLPQCRGNVGGGGPGWKDRDAKAWARLEEYFQP